MHISDTYIYFCICEQKTTFHGLTIEEAKRGISNSFTTSVEKNSNVGRRRGLEIIAKTAGASKNIEVEVDKPLGLTLGQKPGGGVVITVSSA